MDKTSIRANALIGDYKCLWYVRYKLHWQPSVKPEYTQAKFQNLLKKIYIYNLESDIHENVEEIWAKIQSQISMQQTLMWAPHQCIYLNPRVSGGSDKS